MNDWYTKQLAQIERAQASDREVARLTGQSVEQMDYDFDAEGHIIVGDTTLSDKHAWSMIETYLDGLCPVCGTSINQHEIVCDSCLDQAQAYRLHGPPVDWR